MVNKLSPVQVEMKSLIVMNGHLITLMSPEIVHVDVF